MSVIGSNVLAGASGQAGAAGYAIERSLRFNSGDSAYLNRTPSSAGNRKTWTWSGWVKRTDEGSFEPLFSAGNNPWADIAFRNGKFSCILNAGVGSLGAFTDAIYRDQSAWYHLVLAVDTTQSTAADRIKFYVNGVEVDKTADSGGYPSQNYDTLVNSTIAHRIGADGRVTGGGIRHGDCYLADVHFIDGQALAASDFGEYDDNGVWQPIEYTGTYGTNGFHLDFSDNSSAAALGTDSSTNNNDWTVNNIQAAENTGSSTVVSNISSSGSTWPSLDNAFDGSTSTFSSGTGNNGTASTITFNTPLTGVTTLEFYYYGTSNYGYNGSTVGTGTDAGAQWETVYSGTAITVNNLYFVTQPGNGVVYLYAVRVNGTILTGYVEQTLGKEVDSLFDSPTNGTQTDTGAGGEVSGNYATLNPLVASHTYSNGNLDFTFSTTGNTSILPIQATIAMPSGKWYAEVLMGSGATGMFVGLWNSENFTKDHPGSTADSYAYWSGSGNKLNNDSSSSYGDSFTEGDVIGIAFDADGGNLYFYKNGVAQNSGTAAYTGITSRKYVFAAHKGTPGTDTRSAKWNFGARSFAYSAPSGYKALCTANLSDPTLADGSDYMDVVTYNGNGTSQTISGLEFSPDFVWIKERTDTGGIAHYLGDTVRGINKSLQSNATNAEVTDHPYGYISATTSDGFTVTAGSSDNFYTNGSPESYVGWTWDAGHPATAATGAVSFDGTGDWLSIPTSSDFSIGTSDDFTFEAFIYPTSVSDTTAFGIGSNAGFAYRIISGSPYLYVASSGGILNTGTIVAKKWTHIAVTRNSGTLYSFIDGALAGSVANSGSFDGTQENFIGAANLAGAASPGYLFTGQISNVRWVKGTALYTSNFTPPTAELTNVTNTKLLCCQSTTSANAATVSPTLSGINANVFWSSLVSAPSGYYDQAHQAGWLFNGDTSGNSDILPAEGDKWTVSHNFGSVSTLEFFTYYPGGSTSNGANAFEVNGSTVTPISKTNAGWTSLPIAGGTLTSFGIKNTSIPGQDYCFVSAIRVDGTILLDSIGLHGGASATTFNPLDAFSLNGTGYATTSAAGITEGTIPLTGASVNQSAGFSIVSYTGVDTPSSNTVGHGLNVAPVFWIIKNRTNASPQGWVVNFTFLDNSVDYMFLNLTNAKADQGAPWSTLPTSTVFTLGANDGNTCDAGANYIAYCFAPVEGYSAFGSYEGNASTDGPFVYTGFRPAYLLLKSVDVTGGWAIIDSARDPINAADELLQADKNAAEATSSVHVVDMLSNGFKLRGTGGSDPAINPSSTVLYVAFAENPFKYARAR